MKTISAHLVAQLGAVEVPCELYFNEGDPFAVAFVMRHHNDLITWWVSREAIEQAISVNEQTVVGDIGLATTNQSLVMTIKPPGAVPVQLTMSKIRIWLFAAMINKHCPLEEAQRIASAEIDWLAFGLG